MFSASKYVLGAMRCVTESLGRTGCAHWDTRHFSGRGLSKGTAIDYAVSHMPPCPSRLPQRYCFEPAR